ncbi:alpha-galactosidase [Frigoribacterium sp. PhB116]|uniref:alpha-galactosidase n=1 Tax=Frigoribacterium sp. PhB116 TaxID=2485174 RepID=UPI00105F7B86|nr:alpha-galactosidase [Frigoribacterium sp. PhB116]TDT62705.1 alpha-galactosidase [Frigoribacterium sp. PhB116]
MTTPSDPTTDQTTDPATAGHTADATPSVVHLTSGGVSVVLDLGAGRLPVVAWWGAALGDLSAAELDAVVRGGLAGVVPNELDEPEVVELLPLASGGWRGQPGLEGHSAGTSWTPLFRAQATTLADRVLTVHGVDEQSGLAVDVVVELLGSGLLRSRAAVIRTSGDEFVVDSLQIALPVPRRAQEVLDLAGRWGRERAPQRLPFVVGAHLRDSRRGRTGADASLVLAAGTPGFGFSSGEVWTLHVAWSGDHREYAERMASGTSVIGGGELLLPGEVRLAAGETYQGPWVYASWGRGLDAAAARFHEHLRSRPGHPSSPRPVVLNTWEAVYFDHDLDRLVELARAAAEVGAERFVLDDGWFRGRRDDTAGLGDWFVDETVWPDGLEPLIGAVRELGLDFGIWVEPEMVNPDSDLARAHPEWMLAPAGRLPMTGRSQQVLDLGHPEAYAYLLERLTDLLGSHDVAYVKWDHNRDLLEAGHSPTGTPGVHEQTLALYRLLDELRGRFPAVEIESCSSGGARADLGVLERTDRVWASDNIDPLERQQIQRWTSQLLPGEIVGSHVGSPHSHSTGRTHTLAFRAGTALFGHFGVEWDVSRASADERAELSRWVDLYKEVRPLVHTGRVVRADPVDESSLLHGVVSQDGSDALFAFVQLTTPLTSATGSVPLPGLDPARRYRVQLQAPGDVPRTRSDSPPPWVVDGGVVLSGGVLAEQGLQLPALHPEQLLLLRATAL